MPAPLPPANTSLGAFVGRSEPPATKPKLTFETGMIIVPSGEVIGSPIIVLTSTSSLIFSIEVRISPLIGCCSAKAHAFSAFGFVLLSAVAVLFAFFEFIFKYNFAVLNKNHKTQPMAVPSLSFTLHESSYSVLPDVKSAVISIFFTFSLTVL